jgi:hypothetical protein
MITSAHRVPISSFCLSISRSSHLPWQFSTLLCGSQSNFYAILIIRKPFPSCSVESIVLKQCLILCSLFLEPKYSQLACKSPEALTKEQCNMKSILVHCIYQSCHLHLECVPLPLGSKYILCECIMTGKDAVWYLSAFLYSFLLPFSIFRV